MFALHANVKFMTASARRFLGYGSMAIMLAIIVVLALEVRALRPKARELQRRKAFPYAGQVQPTVRAVTLDGDTVVVGEAASGRAQLLIFFAANCPYCRENVGAWMRITAQLRADSAKRFDVIWVSLSSSDSARTWMREHGLSMTDTVVRMPERKSLATYRVRGVPITLLMDERGQILYMHPSVFRTRAAEDSLLRVATAVQARRKQTVGAVAKKE